MKMLFILLFLVSCQSDAEKAQKLADLERIKCKSYIMNFEERLLQPYTVGGIDICDLDPHNQMCGCSGVEILPFDEFRTKYRFDKKIEDAEKNVTEMIGIMKEAKRQKTVASSMKILKEIQDSYKRDVKELKGNKSFYESLIKYNQERTYEVHRANNYPVQSRN